MSSSSDPLVTPIYLKKGLETRWPAEENVFYLLTGDGLFLCRNHMFFRSSVPAPDWPGELAPHGAFIKVNYPRVPQLLWERVIGFFGLIAERFNAEAAALLVWNRNVHAVEVIVPKQRSLVVRSFSGRAYPFEVHYDVPPLAPGRMLIGDIHSHADGPAYSSLTDKQDESHRPGLHIVVGRLCSEPPDLHIEVSADGSRFRLSDETLVLEGYHRRRYDFPKPWIDQVTVRSASNFKHP